MLTQPARKMMPQAAKMRIRLKLVVLVFMVCCVLTAYDSQVESGSTARVNNLFRLSRKCKQSRADWTETKSGNGFSNPKKAGWSYGNVSSLDRDGKRFSVRADDKLTAFVELERQVLTVTFYLESIHGDSCQ
jgi:hypothetical protein